jgi:phospholipid/cholesterol/gamma-HCH transport system substrate-binding protein
MNSKNFAVGIFVSLALAALVSATLWLTGRQGSEPTLQYSMFFEKDVGGLMLGGPVFYLGVNVGSVTSMDIIEGNPMRVRVNAKILKSAPINAGTYASLALQGITGVAVINLSADPGEHGELVRDPDSGYPVIPVRDVGIGAMLSKAPEIFNKLDKALDQVNQLLGNENQRHIEQILNDISITTGALASSEASIASIPAMLEQTLTELQEGIQQLRALAANMEPGLEKTLSNLETVTANLVETTGRLESWTADNDAHVDAFMEEGLGNVPALVSEARAAIREFDKLVKELKEDPSRLIYKPKNNSIDPEQ